MRVIYLIRCNNICNDKAAIFDNLAAFAWKNLFNVYWLVKNGGFVIRKFKMHIEERINSYQPCKH